jgi:hypothetical protein
MNHSNMHGHVGWHLIDHEVRGVMVEFPSVAASTEKKSAKKKARVARKPHLLGHSRSQS